MVNTPGFIELDSALDRTVVWYYRGNTENCASYPAFLDSIKLDWRACTHIGDCQPRTELRKLVNKPTFKHVTTYTETLAAVSLQKSEVHFSKPIYVGFAVLEISKELMYDYHYNVMRRHYNDSIRLMYMDTDSLVYRVNTDDFYKDLVDNPAVLERMDSSNLPVTHPYYVGTRKKIPVFFKDETAGRTMYEFIALNAKSYAYKIEGDESLLPRGFERMWFESHDRCLFEDDDAGDGDESEELSTDDDDFDDGDFGDDDEWKDVEMRRRARLMARSVVDTIHGNAAAASATAIASVKFTPIPLPTYTPYTPYRKNVSIRSFEHRVKMIKTMKMTLNRFDDKRVVADDRIRTRAYGHYALRA
ncbi:DNA pol B 2 domain-containing protein [Aphis craccivora]|uniref:DNA pol B 2 domain-containing protein n=1 Tax=Aphis craccivora TaxID=307492 RepID=A0A6G0X7A5_APHCR|nr:DNA pol B 2 domain-containing protein [Aphis craccivora]